MTAKQDKARKFLDDLEKNPKHTTRTDETDEQTKNDLLNAPSKNEDGDIDSKWYKDENGFWTHPNFE